MIMVITMIIALPAAAIGSNVAYIQDNITAPRGNNITVPIMIFDASGVASIGLKLSYNASIVNVTGVTQGDFTGYFGFDSSNAINGRVTINTYITGTQLTGNITVANIKLEAAGNPGEQSALDLEIITIVDRYANELKASTDNGSFIVSDIAHPDIVPPSINSLHANPSVIYNDGTQTTQLSVTANDESGIYSITVDLSKIGGSPKQMMVRAGNVWTYTTNAFAKPGKYLLRINATDNRGNSNTSAAIELKLNKHVLRGRK